MSKWMRRIRGALGMGLAWALAWFGAGMVLLLVVGPDAADVPFPLGFGALGFLAGITFSGVLGLAEGRRSFEQMSLPRFALWGGVGGLLFAGIFVVAAALGIEAFLGLGIVFALAGAGCASGSLALARRVDDRVLLEGSENAD
jgi:FtsH-binding integral membrane protein